MEEMILTENTAMPVKSEDGFKNRVIFGAAIITAVLFCLCFRGNEVRAGLSSLVFFNAAGIGGLLALKMLGALKNKRGMLIMPVIFALSCFNAYFEYSYYNIFNCIAFFVLFTCMMLKCAGLKTGLDGLLNCWITDMASAAKDSVLDSVDFDGTQLLKVALGAAISLPFLGIITFLLASADDAFFDSVSGILDMDMYGFIWTVLLFAAVFVFGCGFLHRFTEDEQRIVIGTTNIDRIMGVAFLTPVNLLFLFFCCSQLKYLTGSLPINDTYSRFAREGFFQLLIVTFINFSIILVFTDIFKTKAKGALKASLAMLCVFTFALIVSSFYRMYLYIGAYGFTPLRIEVVTFLAVESVLVFTTLYAVLKNRTDILNSFIVGAAVALLSLNITARPEFSARLNIEADKIRYSEYTHSSLPLLIDDYYSTSDSETRELILWHINDLYNENAENWQSVSIQQQRINAETEEFLRSIK